MSPPSAPGALARPSPPSVGTSGCRSRLDFTSGVPGHPCPMQSHVLLRPDQEQRVSSLQSCRSQLGPCFPNLGCQEPLGVKTLHFSGCSSFRPQHFLARTRQRFPELRGFYHLGFPCSPAEQKGCRCCLGIKIKKPSSHKSFDSSHITPA